MELTEKEILEQYPHKAKDSIRCPTCNRLDFKPQARTKPDFIEEPDPHMTWMEGFECGCGTKYHLKNGT